MIAPVYRHFILHQHLSTGLSGDPIFFHSLTDLNGRQLRADRPENDAAESDTNMTDVTGVQPGNCFARGSNAAMEPVYRINYIRQV